MTTTQNTTDLISKARAAGLRLSCAGGKLRITAPPDVRAIFAPQLHEQSAAVLAWLRQEQTARILASSAARSDAATEKAVKLLKRKRKLDRGESLFPCDGHILAIDNSGGIPIECLSDREAVRLFLHWLRDARDRHYLALAQRDAERQHFDVEATVKNLLERVRTPAEWPQQDGKGQG